MMVGAAGGSGVGEGITLGSVGLCGLLPAGDLATTVHVYAAPLVRPVSVAGLEDTTAAPAREGGR